MVASPNGSVHGPPFNIEKGAAAVNGEAAREHRGSAAVCFRYCRRGPGTTAAAAAAVGEWEQQQAAQPAPPRPNSGF